MIFVTFAYFVATVVLGGAQLLLGETWSGATLLVVGVLSYWAGSALKIAIYAPASRPRTVGFILAGMFTLVGSAATVLTGARFDAYGQEMHGIAWVLAGLIAGLMGTRRRHYPEPGATSF